MHHDFCLNYFSGFFQHFPKAAIVIEDTLIVP